MAAQLGVLLIHGIGNQAEDFAVPMVQRLEAELGELADRVVFQSAWWAPLLAPEQRRLLGALNRNGDLDFLRLREFVVQVLGDAVAYQLVPRGLQREDIYREIHQRVGEALQLLRRKLRLNLPPEAPERPLVVIAHSLGCHIISNFLWDAQQGKPHARLESAFESGFTLGGIVMMGCNIPVFSLAYNRFVPISFPGRDLPSALAPGTTAEQIASAASWLNFYDPDDVLGYPLKPLSPEYDRAVTRDLAVNVGSVVTAWNPASHLAYWTDRDVVLPTAALLRDLLALCPSR